MRRHTCSAIFLLSSGAPAMALGPDLTVSDITSANTYGQIDGVHAFMFGVTACNLGDADLSWSGVSEAHPVLAESLYRLSEGRLLQVGISHVAHPFAALQTGMCSMCDPAENSQLLGPGCASPSSTSVIGSQASLGPRAEVNASTGEVQYPFTGIGQSGAPTERRVQVEAGDIEPGGKYFAELQYVAADDAGAGAGLNNASYRRASMSAGESLTLTGPTITQSPAIFAWADEVPGVQIVTADVPGDGRLNVGALATQIGPGLWRYDYAVHNMNSHRSAGSITVPVGGDVSEDSFQAPIYHSGEPVDNQPWAFSQGAGAATWSVGTHSPETDLSANAVRWGTMYTFSFVSDGPPTTGAIEVGMFRPGAQSSFTVSGPTPGTLCAADLAEPFGELNFSDVVAFLTAFGSMSPEADLSEPFGSFDFSDVVAFLTSFGAGCP